MCSALVQETVSRGVSFALGKREEKASQGHLMERLEMAVSELEFALERAMELPIRHVVSLLGRRKQIKSVYVEAMELLHKHKQQQAVPAGQQLEVAHGAKRKRWVLCSAKNMSITSSFAALSTDDFRRFEWYADCAGRFVRDVESRSRFSLSEIKIYRRSWINGISKIYRKYRTKFKKKIQIVLKKNP